MPHHKYARNIAELDFHEDRVLFPGETPQDIIGFCVGLTGNPGDGLKKRMLKITTRRIGINQEYTDIRREVGNLLLRLWKDKKTNLNKFWIKDPRDHFERVDRVRNRRIGFNGNRVVLENPQISSISKEELVQDDDGILFYRLAEAFNPPLFDKIKESSRAKTKKKLKDPIFVNGQEKHKAPLLDLVRPTLLVFTMDASFLKFVDDCVIPRHPSNRLNPYNRNLRLWFNRRVLGWYSHFDADTHKDGGEFWYDLVVQIAPPKGFKNTPLLKLKGQNTFLADPGDGMGGGERFP